MNLKVTAHMLDGRINSHDGLFNLDSILAYAWMKEHHPDKLYNSEITRDGLVEPSLPLEWRGDHWASSSGFFVQYKESIEHYHRRFNDKEAQDYIDFGKRRGSVNTKSGEFKAYRMPQPIRLIPKIEFYAMGNKDEIERLLNTHITNVGKKGAQGYGAVREWTVEPIEEDWTETGPYGVMRPTPFDGELPSGERYQVRQSGTKPPYWLRDNQEICIIPNTRRESLAKATIARTV